MQTNAHRAARIHSPVALSAADNPLHAHVLVPVALPGVSSHLPPSCGGLVSRLAFSSAVSDFGLRERPEPVHACQLSTLCTRTPSRRDLSLSRAAACSGQGGGGGGRARVTYMLSVSAPAAIWLRRRGSVAPLITEHNSKESNLSQYLFRGYVCMRLHLAIIVVSPISSAISSAISRAYDSLHRLARTEQSEQNGDWRSEADQTCPEPRTAASHRFVHPRSS